LAKLALCFDGRGELAELGAALDALPPELGVLVRDLEHTVAEPGPDAHDRRFVPRSDPPLIKHRLKECQTVAVGGWPEVLHRLDVPDDHGPAGPGERALLSARGR